MKAIREASSEHEHETKGRRAQGNNRQREKPIVRGSKRRRKQSQLLFPFHVKLEILLSRPTYEQLSASNPLYVEDALHFPIVINET